MSSDESDLTPESIKLDALGIVHNLLPEKSKEKYLKAYNDFDKWKTAKVQSTTLVRCQFYDCHDDPSYDPDDGPLQELQFTWLGTLQYIHVKNGTPHYFRVPRVVLISRQFALCTAIDAAQIPDGYALGNVVFGDYERDERECEVTLEQIAEGAECEPAVLLMPIADVLLHPEYKHFGVKDSVALLKFIMPVRSHYMVPACIPFKNYLIKKDGKQTTDKLIHIDFSADVPRDFIDEEKDIVRLSLLPRELCFLYDDEGKTNRHAKNRIACTTGCDLHSGAPSMFHETTGHWTVVALATGGAPCPDPLRPRRPPAPPRHLLIHPYVPWITAAITGKAIGAFAKDDPFGHSIGRSEQVDKMGPSEWWVGHWWMGGIDCYKRGEDADEFFKFYHEVFTVTPTTDTFMSYYLELDAATDTMVTCIKVGMPFRLGKPRVWELGTPVAKVHIPLLKFKNTYKFQLEAWAFNTSLSKMSSGSDISSSSCGSDGKDADGNSCETEAPDEEEEGERRM